MESVRESANPYVGFIQVQPIAEILPAELYTVQVVRRHRFATLTFSFIQFNCYLATEY